MDTVLFLVLRRMRAPLLLISTVYAVATLGLTAIPGIDDSGNIWYMDFFHAFYFVTFMGTTIGFGEIPYAFTDAQRLWALIFIYITVVTWIYTIGTILNLLQDETLKRAITQYQFKTTVAKLREPFYLICGYGDTGEMLVDALARRMIAAVVLEIKPERIDSLILGGHALYIPRLCADASDPENMILGGATHPMCQGVVALTDKNAVNLHIAITAKVLRPQVKVVCRAESHDIEANMASFGTDYIVDPFDTFAINLATALHAPHQHLLNAWLRSEAGDSLTEITDVEPGRWVLCGYGRFGKPIFEHLINQDMDVQVIEPNPEGQGAPANCVKGLGTEAVTLLEADIENAVGIVAGTNDDSNNLSIIVTARALNPNLFTVARQTEHFNRAVFRHSGANMVMAPSEVVARKIKTLLTNPRVDDFLSLAHAHSDDWAASLLRELEIVSPNRIPELWEIVINHEFAHAVSQALRNGEIVTIYHLLRDHTDRANALSAITLLHASATGSFCLPTIDTSLKAGDRLLFAGTRSSRSQMNWTLQNLTALEYVLTGEVSPQTIVGKWLFGD